MFEGQEGEGTKKEREMEAERLRGKTSKGGMPNYPPAKDINHLGL